MDKKPEVSSSLPLAVKRASSSLKVGGNFGLWVQLVLGVVSVGTLLVATPRNLTGDENATPATSVGIFFAFAGVIALAISIYFSYRYTRIARRLATADSSSRPSRAVILRQLRISLIVNLVGLLLTLLGAQAIVGLVLVKSLAQPPSSVVAKPQQFVSSIDLLVIQGNVNIIAAHFAGIISSLWLTQRLTK
ncbi:MAG: hypothetical protein BRC33_03340 [Cyanobacteria bacterium SW_9_44_58]|nr:MAG: hypothetical protein BRC33_03340 [Cyanobacteria bacterium SW_9_44_58]